MKLLIIILLLPLAVFAHRYRLSSDPNDTPFLPIYPIHPYSPKLIKRGTEKDYSLGQVYSELYAPKPDARDTYSTIYSGKYQRDTQLSSAPSQNNYQASYTSSNQAFPQSITYTTGSNIPSQQYYNVNPYIYAAYNGIPITLVAQSHSINPRLLHNYYIQQQQQHQQQQQQQQQPQQQQQQHQYSPTYHQVYQSTTINPLQSGQENSGKVYGKYHDVTKNEMNIKDGHFVDGLNYLTNSKDLENSETDISDVHLRSAQLPRTMLRIIPYDGQQFRPSSYALNTGFKYQNVDHQLMNQPVGKVFGPPAITNNPQNQYDILQVNQNVPGKISEHSPTGPVIAKTGLAYVMNPTSFNIAPRHIAKAPDSYQNLDSSSTTFRSQKPVTTVSVEGSHGIYIPPLSIYKNQAPLTDYSSDYSSQNGHIYDSPTSLMPVDYKKNIQNYSPEVGQIVQSGQYQYSGYQPTINNQDNYKITLDDVNYASKRNN